MMKSELFQIRKSYILYKFWVMFNQFFLFFFIDMISKFCISFCECLNIIIKISKRSIGYVFILCNDFFDYFLIYGNFQFICELDSCMIIVLFSQEVIVLYEKNSYNIMFKIVLIILGDRFRVDLYRIVFSIFFICYDYRYYILFVVFFFGIWILNR